ncbi:MAG: heavy metal translocating P-type ATPase [Elainella sp. Prado103]|nr:heavy metal translocating P-type ATPase [Elainella sp. Prado103]
MLPISFSSIRHSWIARLLNSGWNHRGLSQYADMIPPLLCGLLLLLGWLTLHIGWIGLALLILAAAYGIGGFASAREGLTTLWQEKELDVDLLMIVAALGAAGLGLWRQEYYLLIDGAVLILIFSISGALESYAMGRTERSIRSLMRLTPDAAWLLHQGQEKQVSIAQLRIDDQILVKPGELIPTDSVVVDGYSTVNQAAITGESIPVDKTVGDEVFAGTLNGHGALKLRVHQPPESSLIQRVIRLVEQAQTEKPPSQQFIEAFERGYAKVVVVVGVLLMVLPPFLVDWSWEDTIYRALIFLVVASPCALMAAIMPTLLSGIANGASQGILFKNGAQLEQIGRVKAIAFDKTGTLTTGQPTVQTIVPAPGYSEQQVLTIAAALEAYSEHPIGQSIHQAALQRSIDRLPVTDVQAQPGQGIWGRVDSEALPTQTLPTQTLPTQTLPTQTLPLQQPKQSVPLAVGQLTFIQQLLTPSAAQTDQPISHILPVELVQQAKQLQQTGQTVVGVVAGQQLIGLIGVADQVRPEAAHAIHQLKKLGIQHVIMLTGDNWDTAHSIAQQVGIQEVHANLLPEDKLKLMRQLQKRYGAVAMVGDGMNDAPALAQATVGIAMGAAGSDVALETADIVLMTDSLEKIALAAQLGRRSQRIVKQNIGLALSFILLLLIANFAGNITLPIGVIGHEGSTVLVTLSGLRLLKA